MTTLTQACDRVYINAVVQALDGKPVTWSDVLSALVKILEARHEDRLLRLFACDCAEHVLPLYEKAYLNDLRPRQAIDTARRYAEGNATTEEIETAWAAAEDATGDAVWAAAEDAAEDAAGAAAWAAGAAGAAGAAAASTETQWQVQRLLALCEDISIIATL